MYLILAFGVALAQDAPNPILDAPKLWEHSTDTPLLVGNAVVFLTMEYFIEPSINPNFTGKRELSFLDEWTPSGNPPGFADPASDVLLYGTIASGLVISGISGAKNDEFWPSAGILMQSFFLNVNTTNVIKNAVNRPRPYMYLDPIPEESADEALTADAFLSFPSGHTSSTAAVSFTTASILVNHGVKPVPAYLGAGILTTTVGVLRVISGRHYTTDVIAGAAIGTTIGLVTPALHWKR